MTKMLQQWYKQDMKQLNCTTPPFGIVMVRKLQKELTVA